MFCKRCRYNLQSIDSRACPECGRAFDPGNRKTFRKGAGWPKWLRRIFQGLMALCVVVLIALGVIEWRYQQEVAAAEALEQVGAVVWWSKDAHHWAQSIAFVHDRLQHVDYLNLDSTQLTTLPPELWKLTKLAELHLFNNQLTTLPPEIGKLTDVDWLDLGNNQLTTLPPEIGKLTNLTYLNLFNNQLTTLSPELWKFTKLAELNLGGNQLTTVPPELWKLTKLTELHLFNNQLTTLPPEIGKLTDVDLLDLGNNHLTTFPPEIGKLRELERLYLDGNPITDADLKRLTALENLRVLNLSETKVTRQGVAALRLALPNCEIKSDFDKEKP